MINPCQTCKNIGICTHKEENQYTDNSWCGDYDNNTEVKNDNYSTAAEE